MPFTPGQSGNPNGRPPRGHSLADALRDELARMHGKITKQRALARVIVERALAGEYQFANMVMERIDGKATQQIDLAAMVRRIAEREGLDPDLVQAEAERILANL